MAGICTAVLIVGDVATLQDDARALLKAVRWFRAQRLDTDTLHIVVDGPRWQVALADELQTGPDERLTVLAEVCHLPGVLINCALAEADGEFMSFLWPGAEVSTWYANKAALLEAAREKGSHLLAGYRGPAERRQFPTQSQLCHPDDGLSPEYPRGWLQMLDFAPMANSIVRTEWLRWAGGCSEAAALQRAFWWELTLRAASSGPIEVLPLQPIPARGWHGYCFSRERAVTADIAVRIMNNLFGERDRLAPITEAEANEALARDFSVSTARRALRSSAAPNAWTPPDDELWHALPELLRERLIAIRGERPLRITLLGGPNEPAHNQLCFFNYFELMRRWGILSWRTVLDTIAHPADLAQSDLVIFSRVRCANGDRLMDFCRTNAIASVYMLDDNWFWLGREWQEYAELFSPGRPDYEHFLYCLKRADTALTYNKVMAEDMRPHAQKLVVLPTNVDHSFFQRPPRPPDQPLTIGYVGSLRKNLQPFQALVNIARARPAVRLFVMSNSLPDELKALPAERIVFRPYQFNYAGYARTVCEAQPDVLVAPVGRSRFEASKAPNKYLEITACGAAGVYSRAEPYTDYIVEGDNGLSAGDDTGEWQAKIESLIDDAALRARVLARAQHDVSSNFDTRAVLPMFLDMLLAATRLKP